MSISLFPAFGRKAEGPRLAMRFADPLPAPDLNLATLFLAEELAALPGCLYYIEARLTFAFEIKGATAIHETGVVGNEVMSAIITNLVRLA